jgi:hypothetical protein
MCAAPVGSANHSNCVAIGERVVCYHLYLASSASRVHAGEDAPRDAAVS